MYEEIKSKRLIDVTVGELVEAFVSRLENKPSSLMGLDNHTVPFWSINKTIEMLDCSKTFLYDLIREGKLKPKYLGRKPYFMISNILEVMTEKESEK
ncbi:MAG: hypothetical protein J7604_03575 [Sporocytophaga sp.]|uniref:hypothetical protein n=1 Tax=Sporocytophaga sp. TaxID=2231183 RepID=UPI001B076CB8|nr:hypothetical protein [Sporocytophaga sp.]MBO9699261.1 hypothetical protein [Sporocytophaga sp.]